MCGILVKSNFYTSINYRLFLEAANTLNNRGPDESGYLFLQNYALGHKRLVVIDKENGKQPMSVMDAHLVYNGELYNTNEIRNKLKESGYSFKGYSDTEVVLKSISEYGAKALDLFNGIFAFAYVDNDELFAARDIAGVKPLYYSFINDDIIIASEIKAILKYQKQAIVDKQGLQELLGLAPSHSPGNTVFKGIYELKPGHYLKFSKNGLVVKQYFDVKAKPYNLDLEQTIKMVEYLVKDACYRQTISDVPLACFLSGGLDSSIVSMYVGDVKPNLATYSIDYEGNDKEYRPNKFETSDDQDFVNYVVDKGRFKHKNCKIDLSTLADCLKTAVVLKDYPGMADVDASMFWLAKNIRQSHTVALSGECADEIFGGYPWFYRDDGGYVGFPWIRNLDYREELINKNLKDKLNIKEYVKEKYEEIIAKTPILDTDDEKTIKERQMSYLNLKYFMTTLLERKDRMTMGCSLEVRVPFADKRLIEFLYNVPWEYKYFNNTEKALLREACKNVLPEEVYKRKKSPYPKSRSTKYASIVSKLLRECLNNKDSILYTLFDEDKLYELIDSDKDLETPWYGQLMTKPQLMAFLYQIDFWFKEYEIKLDLGGE